MKFCSHCGKEVAEEAVICLSCGCKTQNYGNFNSTNTVVIESETEPQLAIWSKICGIISFFIGWFALGITAIVLASMSKEETNGVMCPSAKVGYVCGIVSTILSSVLFVAIIVIVTALSI